MEKPSRSQLVPTPLCFTSSRFLATLARLANGRPDQPQMLDSDASAPLLSLSLVTGWAQLLGVPYKLILVHTCQPPGKLVSDSISNIPNALSRFLLPQLLSHLNEVYIYMEYL